MNIQFVFEIDSGAPYIPWYRGNMGILNYDRWKNQYGSGRSLTVNGLWLRVDIAISFRPGWKSVKGTGDGREK